MQLVSAGHLSTRCKSSLTCSKWKRKEVTEPHLVHELGHQARDDVAGHTDDTLHRLRQAGWPSDRQSTGGIRFHLLQPQARRVIRTCA